MLSRSLSTSQRFALLFQVIPDLAEFAQSLYPLIVSHADDFGRQAGDLFTVKHKIHPASPRTPDEFKRALEALHHVGLIVWYDDARGGKCLQIVQFDKHQTGLHKRTRSDFPAPPGNSRKFPEIPGSSIPTELNRTELKGTERKKETDQERAPKEPVPTKALLTLFESLHEQTLGMKADMSYGRDAKILADLVKQREVSEVEALIRAFFLQPDEWVRTNGGFTVPVFKSQVAKLLLRLKAPRTSSVPDIAASLRFQQQYRGQA